LKSSSRLFKIAEPYLLSLLFPSLYSLNNGSTKNGYSENAQFRHSDKAPGRNLYAIASRLSSTNGEPLNGQPVFLALTNLQPPTSDPGLYCNSHLGTCNCSFRRTENLSTVNQFLCSFQPPTLAPKKTGSFSVKLTGNLERMRDVKMICYKYTL